MPLQVMIDDGTLSITLQPAVLPAWRAAMARRCHHFHFSANSAKMVVAPRSLGVPAAMSDNKQ
jgi:hypothetical protein